MGAQTLTQPVHQELQTPHWSLGSRVLFRFCFVYFGLYCCTTQILSGLLPLPDFEFPDLASLWPTRQILFWTAAHVFHVSQPLVYAGSGSGDKTFDWMLVFCLAIVGVLATAVWSVLDRRRANYVTLHKWFYLFIRFGLASEMILYGLIKVVPLQMPFPYLTRLLQPYGNFSPMGILWSFIGSSPAYETFTGCAEALGGILLIVPRTTMFGALLCLADSVQIFMLNMTYDVPVKLLSFHLILLSFFLLAPELRRLIQFFFLNRIVDPSTRPALFARPRLNRAALVAQVLFGVLLIGLNSYGSWKSWGTYGGGRVRSPLYGIWNVEQLSLDGQVHAPVLTDTERWRRVIFDIPTSVAFARIDDSLVVYGAKIDMAANSLTLTSPPGQQKPPGTLTFHRAAQDQLILDGRMENRAIHMELRRMDLKKFQLVSRGFHWIQEYPYNR